MAINKEAIEKLRLAIGHKETEEVVRLARKAEKLENKWVKQFENYLDSMVITALKELYYNGRLDESKYGFERILGDHMFDVFFSGIKTKPRLSAPPKPPKNIKDWFKAWDAFRKSGKVPRRVKVEAGKFKEMFLNKVQSVWNTRSEDFIEGDAFNQEKALNTFKKTAALPYSRSKTIVQTETTKYYNDARREFYDQSEDVTHYLFLAIRDHRTTKWCKDRHDLVYTKPSEVLDKETPPIHWNCRSEIVPLTPYNPKHKKLIENKSLRRENNKCEPLPPGWK